MGKEKWSTNNTTYIVIRYILMNRLGGKHRGGPTLKQQVLALLQELALSKLEWRCCLGHIVHLKFTDVVVNTGIVYI